MGMIMKVLHPLSVMYWIVFQGQISATQEWTTIPPPRAECAGSNVALTWGYTATQRTLLFIFDSSSESGPGEVNVLIVNHDNTIVQGDARYPWTSTVTFTPPGTITIPNISSEQSGTYTCQITTISQVGGQAVSKANTTVTVYSQCPTRSAFYIQDLQLGSSKVTNSSVVQVIDGTSSSLVASTPVSFPLVGVVFYRRVTGGTETTITHVWVTSQRCTASLTSNNGDDYIVRSVYSYPALKDSVITFNINTAALTIDQQLPSQLDVVVGESLSVECIVKGKPLAVVTWSYKGGQNLLDGVLTTRPSTTKRYGNFYLTSSILEWAQGATTAQRREAGGRYTCTGESNVGLAPASSIMDLNVQYGPYNMKVLPTSTTADEGDDVEVTCSAQCNPQCSFAWINMASGSPVTVYSGSTLRLSNVKRHQQGTYRCRAQNLAGNSTMDVSLDVHYIDKLVFEPSDSQTIPEGNTHDLTCSVNSRPMSNIKLTNGTSGDHVLSQSSGPAQTVTYTFELITCWDAGTYTCMTDNGHTQQSSVVLDVSCPPGIYQTEPPLMKEGANIGDNATFKLWVIARPKPSLFTWTFRPTGRQPEPNLPTNTHVISEEYTSAIFITKSIEANFGYYECVVENSIAPSAPVVFELVPESKPSPPSNLTLVASTAVSMTVAWIPGWNGGSTQMFTLTYTDAKTEQTIDNIPDVTDDSGPWRAFVVQKVTLGVIPSTTYRFTVLAKNEVEMSDSIEKEFRTTVRPSVSEGSLHITIFSSEGYGRLMGTISQGRVSYILVDACQTKPSGGCIVNNITEMTSSRRRRSLPVGEPITADINITSGGDEYRFNISFYDGVDLVYSIWTEPYSAEDGNSNVGDNEGDIAIVAGGVVGGVAVITIIVVVIVLVIRRRNTKQDAGDQQRSLFNANGRKKGRAASANDNPCVDEEISPYGVVQGNVPDLVAKGNGGVAVNKNPGDLYAAVDKKKRPQKHKTDKAVPLEVLYAQPNLAGKHKRKTEQNEIKVTEPPQTEELDEETFLVDNTTYTTKPNTDRTQTGSQPKSAAGSLYEEVGQGGFPSKAVKQLIKEKKPKQPPVKPSVGKKPGVLPKKASSGHHYGENPYQNTADLDPAASCGEHAYGNLDPTEAAENQRPKLTVGVDGIVYSELSFGGDHSGAQGKGRSANKTQDQTTYASIDFDKNKK